MVREDKRKKRKKRKANNMIAFEQNVLRAIVTSVPPLLVRGDFLPTHVRCSERIDIVVIPTWTIPNLT